MNCNNYDAVKITKIAHFTTFLLAEFLIFVLTIVAIGDVKFQIELRRRTSKIESSQMQIM
ncbi:hypothetical protein IJH10_01795 [Candidatus Saccharibacteria bacterium]|nr:hypothetical protein [Candidatus Saccharibacteria bacterium]